MNRLVRPVRSAAVAALALAGCATRLPSTLPPPAPPPDYVSVSSAALAPAAVEPELQRVQAELSRRLGARDWGVPVQVGRLGEAMLRVRLGADESFEPGSAELMPQALLLYATIADVLAQSPACVVHVLAHADRDSGDEPAVDLTARRAASVRSYLSRRGVPATRLRAEGRGAREPISEDPGAADRRIEIVLRPIVAGREAEAWQPPPANAACAPCSAP